MRLVVGAERSCELAVRIRYLRPIPSVQLEEGARPFGRVDDVDPEVAVLGMGLDKRCVGDRLALAGASPGRPDIDEERCASEILERDLLAVERRAGEHALRSGRRRRLLSSAACQDDRSQDDRNEAAKHDSEYRRLGATGPWESLP